MKKKQFVEEDGLVEEVMVVEAEELPIRAEAKAIVKRLEEDWFDLSVVLSEIYHAKVVYDWTNTSTGEPYKNFSEYVEQELNTSSRRGHYNVQMGDAIKQMGLDKEKIIAMGWTKFKDISGLVNQATTIPEIDRILEDTKDLTSRETEEYVKAVKTKNGIQSGQTTISFKFNDEQTDAVESSLAIMMDLLETTNRNIALEGIILEWSATYNPDFIKQYEEKLKENEVVEKAPSKEYSKE